MEKIDLLNSHDVLSVARRWAPADATALDLAQRLAALDLANRLTSRDEVAAEVSWLTRSLQSERRREVFWDRVSLLGLATMVPSVLAGILLVLGVEISPQYLELVAGRAERWVPVLGIFFWFFIGSTLGASATAARKHAEAQLTLLNPVDGTGECHLALQYINGGRPEVLAWRAIAIRDREVLYAFDVAILRALHEASMDARSAEEKAAAASAARQQLYGGADTSIAASAPVSA